MLRNRNLLSASLSHPDLRRDDDLGQTCLDQFFGADVMEVPARGPRCVSVGGVDEKGLQALCWEDGSF